MLAETFNVDVETVRKLQGQNDERGTIVRAEKFQVIMPQREQEEEQQQEEGRERYNGLEETFCTLSLIHNIGNPSRADVYNPRGGRISHVNSQKLPILNYLQLSAERGVLYRVRLILIVKLNVVLIFHLRFNSHYKSGVVLHVH